jgi:hypothetical protein
MNIYNIGLKNNYRPVNFPEFAATIYHNVSILGLHPPVNRILQTLAMHI